MTFTKNNTTYHEPVKHKVGMLCSFSDVSILEHEGCICRNCGGRDYSIQCDKCQNWFNSSAIECPTCAKFYY